MTRARAASLLGLPLLLIATVTAAHWRSLREPFFYDDWLWLNVAQRGDFLDQAFGGYANPIFRPGLAVWFFLLRHVFGLHVVWFHLAALAGLVACGLLLAAICRRCGLPTGPAALAGVLYAGHGAFAPAVAWSSASASQVAVALALASTLLLLREARALIVAMATVLFALGVLTREVAIVTPALVVALRLARSATWVELRRSVLLVAPMATLAVGYVLFRSGVVPIAADGPYKIGAGPFMVRRMITAMRWFSRDAVPIPNHALALTVDLAVWGGILALTVLAVQRRNYLPLAGLVWFGLACAPALVLPNHPFDSYYLDLPLAGVALAVAAVLPGRLPQWLPASVAAVLLVAMGLSADRAYLDMVRGQVETDNRLRASAGQLRQEARSGVIHVPDCPDVHKESREGDLYRVVLHQPQLRVLFDQPC